MVRVVGKEGALGAGVGGNCSSGMDGSETITIYIKYLLYASHCCCSTPVLSVCTEGGQHGPGMAQISGFDAA